MKIVADIDLPFVQEYFGSEGELILKPGRSLRRADVMDADLLLVRSITMVDEKLLKGSAVKCVATVTTGFDHLDTAWLNQAGISWLAAEGYNAIPVADYVIAVIAALQQLGQLPRHDLRAGIVGVGRIGGEVTRRLRALGYEVLCCDPPRAEQEPEFISQPLAALRDVDFLSLHTPLTHSGQHPSYHLIDEAFLQAGKRNTFLLNSSRGAVVDFAAVKSSLENWRYGFDVWEKEPEIDKTVLQAAQIASPHLAGYSIQCRYRGIDMIYQELCRRQIIKPALHFTPPLPRQTLSFEGQRLTWQEVVLAIFNPLSVTQVMKETLLADKPLLKAPGKCATLFDELRQHYIGEEIRRHEFAYTTISHVRLDEVDRHALIQLGITIEE